MLNKKNKIPTEERQVSKIVLMLPPWMTLIFCFIAGVFLRATYGKESSVYTAAPLIFLAGLILSGAVWHFTRERKQFNRIFVTYCMAIIFIWFTVVTFLGLNAITINSYWYIGVITAIVWNLRTGLHDSESDSNVEKFFERIGATGVKGKVAKSSTEKRLDLELDLRKSGETISSLEKRREEMAKQLQIQPNLVKVIPHESNSARPKISFVKQDYLKGEVAWQRSEFAGQSIAAGPIRIGQYEDGDFAYLDLYAKDGARHILISGMTGAGKAQPLDSMVLTTSGFKPMGDIAIGEKLINPYGQESIVTHIHPQGLQKTYRITLNDGSQTECNEEHLWPVRYDRYIKINGKKQRFVDSGVKPLKDFNKPYRIRNNSASVKLTASIESKFDLLEKELPIDPYLLGLLLGDGHMTNNIGITSHDQEILNYVEQKLPGRRETYRYNIYKTEIKDQLKELGLYGKPASSKFVPLIYKNASYDTRLSILQGLMDTDGSGIPNGGEFSSCSRQLSEDVVWLARSLGFRATISTNSAGYKKNGEYIECLPRHRVRIKGSGQLFRLGRKTIIKTPRFFNASYPQKIVNIEYVGYKEQQCITVSAENQLYITDDFIVTHNSVAARTILADLIDRTDVSIIAIDVVKKWQTLRCASEGFSLFATESSVAEYLMHSMLTTIADRAEYLGSKGYDAWEPGCGINYLVLLIEEAPSVIRDEDAFTRIVERARSVGVSVIASIQRASHSNISTDARAQFSAAMCFGVRSQMDASFVLGDLVDSGADPSIWQAKKKGYCYLTTPDLDIEKEVTPLRIMHVSQEQVQEIAAGKNTELDKITSQSLNKLLTQKEEIEEVDDDSELEGIDINQELTPMDLLEFPKLDTKKLNPEEARSIFIAGLQGLKDQGRFTPKDLYPISVEAGRTRPWIHQQLNKLINEGYIKQEENGEYVFLSKDLQLL